MVMSEGTTDTISSSNPDNLASGSSEIQVYRTIRRSPRRFSPITATPGKPARSDGENQGIPPVTMLPIPMMPIEHRGDPIEETDTVEFQNEELRRTIDRQKRQLLLKVKCLERVREELERSKQLVAEMEKELEGKDDELTFLRKNEQQYRNWWLNEIQFTKLLLNKIPDPNRDIDLVRASQAHYLGHY
ncbi:hypothetical protein BKA70DRAFT_1424233 [Coprinopsis sp. MPI-PUGE-AT-0042]|nr:hypothetical protein BKA70DRAFT_1233933 [Coprinopsis sp. MPI-PUGE-AT-0042]KAH6910574.1 hypothetical protein BKA70DRAFT_1424233 [Coprinopsis sp. MPI-PUGE-AT-0042]